MATRGLDVVSYLQTIRNEDGEPLGVETIYEPDLNDVADWYDRDDRAWAHEMADEPDYDEDDPEAGSLGIGHLVHVAGRFLLVVVLAAYILGFLTCLAVLPVHSPHAPGLPSPAKSVSATLTGADIAPSAPVGVPPTTTTTTPATDGAQPQGPSVTTVTPDGYPVTYGVDDVPVSPNAGTLWSWTTPCVPTDAAVFVWCPNYSGPAS